MEPQSPAQLDPQALALAKAIRHKESGDNFTAKGKSGEFGAYQFTKGFWQGNAHKYLGSPDAPLTPENQNKVAYSWIKERKDAGLNPAQIASEWNSGSPNHVDDNYRGVNQQGVAYDTPAYVKEVYANYQKFKQQNPLVQTANAGTGEPQQQDQGPSVGGFLKNAVHSAGDFIGGTVGAVAHPINTVSSLANLGAGALESGIQYGADKLGIPNNHIISPEMQQFQGAKDFYNQRYGVSDLAKGDVGAAAGKIGHTLYTDPVGAAADISAATGIAGGIASKIGRVGAAGDLAEGLRVADAGGTLSDISKANVGSGATAAKVGEGLSRASDLTNPILGAGKVGGLIGKALKGSGEYTLAKILGKDTGTIKTIADEPGAFSPSEIGNLTRENVGKQVGDALSERQNAIQETGSAYNPVRTAPVTVKVEPNFLDDLIKENAGVEIENGQIVASAGSKIREARDVRALQQLYDTYAPVFASGQMTPNEYLNFRSDLANAARYDREFTASKPLEGVASRMRGQSNAAIRGQVPGLEELDNQYAPQIEDYNRLKAGLLDKNGNLSDAAINRIANATGKGKDLFLQRLEEIAPGITKKIRQVKALEDIQNIHRPGTYFNQIGESAGLITGLAHGNLPLIAGSIAGLFLNQPENAVRLLRLYGGSSKLAGEVLKQLQVPAKAASQGLVGAQRVRNATGVR